MEAKIFIREVRIYFQSKVTTNKELGAKVSIGNNIPKMNKLTANRFCKRWESAEEIKLTARDNEDILIEIVKFKGQVVKKIVAKGRIEAACFDQVNGEELKICLTNNGQVLGWLYCQFSKGFQPKQKKQHFLNLHRLTASFLDMRDEDCIVSVYLNDTLIFLKEVQLKVRRRTLFPSLKLKVKKSDLLAIQIGSRRQKGNLNLYLMDKLQSGQTALLQSWTRNKVGNKMGDFEVQYFLQNFFLPNQSPVFSQPQKTDKQMKVLRFKQQLTKKQQQNLRMSINIQSLTHIGCGKDDVSDNSLLRRVIRGERRRKHVLYCPENSQKIRIKAPLQMDLIIEDSAIDQV